MMKSINQESNDTSNPNRRATLWLLTIFFHAAIFGNASGVWQDEQEMSLGAIERVDLPISESDLQDLKNSEPSIFMGDLGFYFWPIVSLSISLVCFLLSYRHLFKVFGARLPSKAARIIFGLMPVILFVPVFGVVSLLDNVLRINW